MTHQWAENPGRDYLKSQEMEEMSLTGLDIEVRHLKNDTPDHPIYRDRPQNERDYSGPGFQTKALIRYADTLQNLGKWGVDSSKFDALIIFSIGHLEAFPEKIRIGDVVNFNDGHWYEIKTVKRPNEFRLLHEPSVLRIACTADQFRHSTLTQSFPLE